ncbi:MAG: YtxH domain-containing protein, partial [Anaerolineales bacterium]
MAEKNGEFGAFVSGFVMGALVGGAVALLMAPLSGEEARTMIKDKSIELKDITAEKTDQLTQKTKEGVSSLQKRGQEVLEEQKARLAKKQEPPEEVIIAYNEKRLDLHA